MTKLKVRILKEDWKQTEKRTDGRYYLRASIKETEGEVLSTEEIVDHRPSTAEINKAKADAAEIAAELTREENLRIVAGLKQQLTDTDYKVIKNSEWAATQAAANNGVLPTNDAEGWPYDPVALHSERQALRDQIHEYENEPTAEQGEG